MRRVVSFASLCFASLCFASPSVVRAQTADIADIQPGPGPVRDIFAIAMRTENTIPGIERQLALLDSALGFARGSEVVFLGYHRGMGMIGLGRLLDAAMLQGITCETAHRATLAWRGAPAAFGPARTAGFEEVGIELAQEVPAALMRAGANERRLCPLALLNADKLPQRELAEPGAGMYARMSRIQGDDLAAQQHRVLLLDSAVQISQGFDRVVYSFRRGQESVVYAQMMGRIAEASCDAARRTTAAWRAAAAAYEGGRGLGPRDYDFNVEQVIPVNIERAEQRETRLCPR